MNENDFSELGREIGDKIDKFVKSRDIKDLQDNIKLTVEKTMDEFGRSMKDAVDYMSRNAESRANEPWQKPGGADGGHQHKRNQPNGGQRAQGAQRAGGNARSFEAQPKQSRMTAQQLRQLPVVKRPAGSISGVLLTVLGSIGAIISLSSLLFGFSISFITNGLWGFELSSAGILGAAGVLSILAIARGGFLSHRATRFKRYIGTMGKKDFYSISGLAEAVHRSEKYAVKDLKKMIRRGWFKEGHLDEHETCFMLTDNAYQLYLNAQAELKRRKEEEERLRIERELLENDPVRKQLKVTVEEGKECIRRISEVNDDIPGEEISNKLYRLEKICTRIFEHIEYKPEKLPDIRKFMNYYLPTTLKLVETYHEFSLQPVQGENITTAKKEIEETLDEISGAFEKMFDRLFEDDAMDISTDISVLSTMLAQEGLLKDGLSAQSGK